MVRPDEEQQDGATALLLATRATVKRYCSEYDLNLAEVLGCLEMIKLEIHAQHGFELGAEPDD